MLRSESRPLSSGICQVCWLNLQQKGLEVSLDLQSEAFNGDLILISSE